MTKQEIQERRNRKKAENRNKEMSIEDLRKLEAHLKWVSTAKLHEIITTKEQADLFMLMLRALQK